MTGDDFREITTAKPKCDENRCYIAENMGKNQKHKRITNIILEHRDQCTEKEHIRSNKKNKRRKSNGFGNNF